MNAPVPNSDAATAPSARVGPPGRPLSPRTWLGLALGLAVGHFAWLAVHQAPAIMSPDANGYVVQARLLAEEGRTWFSPASPVQYVGMHWLETAPGVFHSRYPAGLPLLMAAAWKLGGLTAALWLNPLLASATVLLVFLLARRLVPAGYALLAAAVVATVPVTNQHALDADAHVAATFFLTGGVLALGRFGETGGRRAGLIAGLALGTVPAIRYPEAIVGLTIAGWLLWRMRPWTRVWPAVAGALVPVGALGVHNTAAYGAFWRTGYSLTNEQTGFGLQYFASHAIPYLQALGGQGAALMFAFGLAGLVALAVDPRQRPVGILFAGLAGPLVLLYMAYYFGGGGPGGAIGNLRFLIPTFPFFAVAGVWVLARLAEQLGPAGRAAVVAVAGVQLLVGLVSSGQTLAAARVSLSAAAQARRVAEKETPAGSILIADRQLAESLDATGRWRLVEEGLVNGLGGPGIAGPGGRGGMARPAGRGGFPGGPGEEVTGDDPSPMQRGKNRAQQERYAGLLPEERRARVWQDLRAWAAGREVFIFARSLEALDGSLPEELDYRRIAEVDAPNMMTPGLGGAGGAMGRGGPGMPGRGIGTGVGRGAPMEGGAGRGFVPPSGAGAKAGARGFMPGVAGKAGLRSGIGPGGTVGKLYLVRLLWPEPAR